MMLPPILTNKVYPAPSVFTPDNLLREARRQKSIPQGSIPTFCILDPDGDIAQHLVSTGQAVANRYWACYHTKLYTFTHDELKFEIIPPWTTAHPLICVFKFNRGQSHAV